MNTYSYDLMNCPHFILCIPTRYDYLVGCVLHVM